jgi:YD repeat-containing protein
MLAHTNAARLDILVVKKIGTEERSGNTGQQRDSWGLIRREHDRQRPNRKRRSAKRDLDDTSRTKFFESVGDGRSHACHF